MQLLKNLKSKQIRTAELKEGDLIEISKEDSVDWSDAHKSRLEKIVSNDEIYMLAPMSNGYVIKLNKNRNYRIIFKSKRGILINLVKVVDYVMEDGIPMIQVKLLKDAKALQRRNSFRLEKTISFYFGKVEEEEGQEPIEDILNTNIELNSKGETVDISSGGMKFYANEELQIDDIIKVGLRFDDFSIFMVLKVLVKDIVESTRFRYSYKAKIVQIEKKEQEELAKRIFEIQRKLASRGCLIESE